LKLACLWLAYSPRISKDLLLFWLCALCLVGDEIPDVAVWRRVAIDQNQRDKGE
jgi:hypothetical protein